MSCSYTTFGKGTPKAQVLQKAYMETTDRRIAWTFEEEHGAKTHARVVDLMLHYGETFDLLHHPLKITTSRKVFGRWLGRRIPSAYGGAYVYLSHSSIHAILINLERIDHSREKSLEIVVAEELMHMRDWLDGDRRGHAKHGHDRIALRVSHVTGASIDEVRRALVPVKPRQYRYVYACPNCEHQVPRKRRGKWACRLCYNATGRQYVLQLVAHLDEDGSVISDVQ